MVFLDKEGTVDNGLYARASYRGHKKKVNEENTIPVIIPGGLTKILQHLDILVNKSFKTNLRQIWES